MHKPSDLSHITTHYQHSGAAREATRLDDLGEWYDSSKIDCLHLCPQKYYYRYEKHLLPKGYTPTAAEFGSAIHAGIAALYSEGPLDKVTCPCPMPEAWGGCQFCGGKKIPRFHMQFLINYPFDPDPDSNATKYTRKYGVDLLAAYLIRWKDHIKNTNVVAVESPFMIPFTDHSGRVLFVFVGRIDLVIREGKKVKPEDHKTHSRSGDLFDCQFKLSGQMTSYMYAVSQIFDINVYEADIDALHTLKVIKDELFHRITTTRTPEEFDRWKQEIYAAREYILHCKAKEFWPMHAPFSCTAYNVKCEYYSLCTAGADMRRDLIDSAYEEVPWEPHD